MIHGGKKSLRAARLLSMLGRITVYENAVILVLFLWGVFAAIGAEPPTYVSMAMPHWVYAVWIGIHLLAPPIIWFGQASKDLRNKGVLQCTGHVVLTIMSATYIIAVSIESVNEKGAAYQLLMFIGFGLCTILLSVRDAVLIAHSEGLCTKRNGSDD